MIIEDHYNQKSAVTSESELVAILLANGGSLNEFYLSHDPGQSDAEALLIGVNGHLAMVSYLPAGDHPGFHAFDNSLGLDPDGSTEMIVGGEPGPAWNAFVIKFVDALAGAKEYLAAGGRPTCLRWKSY